MTHTQPVVQNYWKSACEEARKENKVILSRVSEQADEIEQLKRENKRLKEENAQLKAEQSLAA